MRDPRKDEENFREQHGEEAEDRYDPAEHENTEYVPPVSVTVSLEQTQRVWSALVRAGGVPLIAREVDKTIPLDQYESVAQSEEFKQWQEAQLKDFAENFDKHAIAQVHRLTKVMARIEGEIADEERDLGQNPRQLARLSKETREYLKIMAPMLERIAKAKSENFPLNLLELRIEGINDNEEEK